jgi:phosphatidylethanolamine/phosphatidyl-N-methylethanolamine N-methyltransferase
MMSPVSQDDLERAFLFGLNSVRHPWRNASFLPSSKTAAQAILTGLDFSSIDTIVELGPGIGVVTAELLKKCNPGTKLLLIEIDAAYISVLKRRFGDRVELSRESAHLFDSILTRHNMRQVDLIVSGLPFLPRREMPIYLDAMKRQVDRGAIFRMFTRVPPVMKRVYRGLHLKKIAFTFRNIPPMWVYGIN